MMEGPDIWDYLLKVWKTMCSAIDEGLSAEGELQGGLHVQRKARFLYTQHHMDESANTREERLVTLLPSVSRMPHRELSLPLPPAARREFCRLF